MFEYLDSDKKGYISYHDFSRLAEENRRKLDAFDYDKQKIYHVDRADKNDWIENYLNDTNVNDLDNMAKVKVGPTKVSSGAVTQAIMPRKMSLPKKILKDDNFRFGVSSKPKAKDPAEQTYTMNDLINHNYLKK